MPSTRSASVYLPSGLLKSSHTRASMTPRVSPDADPWASSARAAAEPASTAVATSVAMTRKTGHLLVFLMRIYLLLASRGWRRSCGILHPAMGTLRRARDDEARGSA